MGTDTPVAALSQRSRLLYDYFEQNFAQVTNPPLDAIREEIVTSVSRVMGPEQNLLEPGPASCRHIQLPYPVIDNDELAKLIHINDDGDLPGFACTVLSGLYEVDGGGDGARRGDRAGAPRGVRGDRGRRAHAGAVRPRLRPPDGADPVAAAGLRGAPPPGAHQGTAAGRAGRRDR